VTVQDKVAPVPKCNPITVQLDSTGNYALTAADIAAIGAGSTDACGIKSMTVSPKSFTCSNVGGNPVTLTVCDNNGNTSQCTTTVTVQDKVAPVPKCNPITVQLDGTGNYTLTAADIAAIGAGSTDACGIKSMTVSPKSFTCANVGGNPVTLTVCDNNGNVSMCSATVTVVQRATTLAYTGATAGQYSDPTTLTAKLTDTATGAPLANKQVTFTLGSQSVSASTDANGIASSSLTLTQAPGSYTVTASFGGACPYLAKSASAPFKINCEDARPTYTGALFASTKSTNDGGATVTLSATIQDITAVTGDPAYDLFAGDIRKATVTFINRDNNTAIATVPIGLVNAADTKTGTATYNWSVNIGTADSAQYTIGIIVTSYYTRNNSSDDTVVTVSKPYSTSFITGGGYLLIQNSAGLVAGSAGTKNNFGFNVKNSSNGPKGNINTIIRNNGRTYQIKGNAMTSLATQPNSTGGTATFNGKANIQDITDPLSPIAVDGNATLQVKMTDRGEPGNTDSIAITVWNKSGGLWFSSNWNGTQTVELTLGGGNLVVH